LVHFYVFFSRFKIGENRLRSLNSYYSILPKLGQAIYIGGQIGIIYFKVYTEIEQIGKQQWQWQKKNNNKGCDGERGGQKFQQKNLQISKTCHNYKRNLMFGIWFKNIFSQPFWRKYSMNLKMKILVHQEVMISVILLQTIVISQM
jgi:hypothetical protein